MADLCATGRTSGIASRIPYSKSVEHKNFIQSTAHNANIILLNQACSGSVALLPTYDCLDLDERTFSASRPSSRTFRVLISVQPASSTAKLRRVSVARHSTIIWSGRDQRGGLDAFAIGIAATVASANRHVSIMVSVQ